MPGPLPKVLDRVRQPAYTGENRCVPCTVVNLLIGGVLASGLGLLGWWLGGPVVGLLFGLGTLVIAIAAIGLRGYLVPGTPELTKRFFPEAVLKWFDKSPADTAAGQAPEDGAVDVERVLLNAGALEECVAGEDLCLTDPFRELWFERIEEVQDTAAATDALADMLGVAPDRLRIEDHGEAFVAVMDDQLVGQWESRPAFLADLGAARALSEHSTVWPELGVRERSTVLDGLRLFLDSCPACGGDVTFGEDVVESCCRSVDVVAVTCISCEARLFEAESPA